jgi:hypothetical protein
MSNTIPSTNELSKKKELNLWNKQYVKNSHLSTIADSLKTNTSLTFLGFRECKGVSDNGAVAIANVIGSTNSTLKKLNFENTMVGDVGIIALAESLPSSGLTRLDLAYTKITDTGGMALASALSNGVSIGTLALGKYIIIYIFIFFKSNIIVNYHIIRSLFLINRC